MAISRSASLTGGGKIFGDLTIDGDLTVDGNNAGAYDEIINGQLQIYRDDSSTTGADTNRSLYLKQAGAGDVNLVFSDNAHSFNMGIDNSANAFKISTHSHELHTNTKFTLDTNGNVGIGNDSPVAKLEIQGANGTVSGTPDADGDEFVIRNNNDAGMSILAGESSGHTSSIIFGSTSDLNGANVFYEYNTKTMKLGTQHASGILTLRSANGVTALTLDESQNATFAGNVGIGVTDIPSALMVTRAENSAFNGATDDGQDGEGSTITVSNNSTSANSFAQLNFQVSASSGRGVARIVGIREASQTSALAFVTENSNTASEKIRITGAGNVGIGTSSPDANLEIEKDAGDLELRLSTHSDTESHTSSLTFFKSDNTAASPATIDAGSVLGQIIFNGYDDNNYETGAMIKVSADAQWSSSERGTDIAFYTRDANASLSQNMTLTAEGRLGIGTDSPASKLHIQSANEGLRLANATNGSNQSIGVGFYSHTANTAGSITGKRNGSGLTYDLLFSTTSNIDGDNIAEAMRITGAGNVGIGNSSLETHHASLSVLQLGGDGAITATTTQANGNDFFITRNAYYDATNTRWEYMSTNSDDEAERLAMSNGTYSFDLTGTAGADDTAITFISALKLDSNSRISLSNNDSGASNTIFGNLAGNAVVSGTTNNVLIGHSSGTALNSGDSNVMIGVNAGLAGTSATNNIYIGQDAAKQADAERDNVVIGHQSFDGAVNGADYCVVMGSEAMRGAVTQDGTVAIGTNALLALTSGEKNLAVGYRALYQQNECNNSIAIGYLALSGTDAGDCDDNVAIGNQSLSANMTHVSKSTAIGTQALGSLAGASSPTQNIGIGYQAGLSITNSSNNIAIGANALGESGSNALTGSGNIAIGTGSLYNQSGNATKNTAIGYNAGLSITTGNSCTILGYDSEPSAVGAVNQTVIGSETTGVADNSVSLGNSSVTNLYIAKGNDTAQTITFMDSSNTGGDIQYDHSDNQMKFGVADAVRARLFADTLRPGANDTQDLGTASAGWRTLYVTDGINFPDDASANPSSDANTLDNYEEGTWTPTVSFSTGSGTVAYNIQQGTYTKIGNIVHITGRVRTTDIAERTGTVAIAGLPFTANATYFPAISITLGLGLTITANQALTGYVNASSTVINLQIWETTAGTNMLVHTDWSDGGSISFTTSYRV